MREISVLVSSERRLMEVGVSRLNQSQLFTNTFAAPNSTMAEPLPLSSSPPAVCFNTWKRCSRLVISA